MKIGDKVICIDYDGQIYTYKLEKYKMYTIDDIKYDYSSVRYYIILEEPYRFSPDRFISLKEYRKQKIQKICSSQEIK